MPIRTQETTINIQVIGRTRGEMYEYRKAWYTAKPPKIKKAVRSKA